MASPVVFRDGRAENKAVQAIKIKSSQGAEPNQTREYTFTFWL